MLYPTPFWRAKGLSGLTAADKSPVGLTFDRSPRDGSRGVLVVFLDSAYTPASAEARRASVLRYLRKHLGSEAVQAKSDDEIKAVITEGVGKMKPPKGLSGTDVDKILAFLRTIEE